MPELHRVIDTRQIRKYPNSTTSYHIQGIDRIKMADDHDIK